jgi:phosphoribosyl-ATP pyrophosphohydrolase
MSDILARIEQQIFAKRGGNAETSYIAALSAKGRAKIAQKLGEEATETVIAAMEGDTEELTKEAADLLFHLLMLLADGGVTLADVLGELERREGVSGIAEKAARTE